MFSWFVVNQSGQQVRRKNQNHGEKSIVTSKVAPSVKSTSVSVIIDDAMSNVNSSIYDATICTEPESMTMNESIRSASKSLTIELAKKTSVSSLNGRSKARPIPFMQKTEGTMTPQSSLPRGMTIQKKEPPPSSITSNGSSRFLLRLASSPRTSVAAFPTSVSANGSVIYDHREQEEDVRSAAIESLIRRIDTSSPACGSDMEEDFDYEEEVNTTRNTSMTMNDEYFVTLNKQDEADVKEVVESPTLSTCENKAIAQENKGGLMAWLRISSYSNEQKDTSTRGAENLDVSTKEELLPATTTTTTATSCLPQLPQNNVEQKTSVSTTTFETAENSSWTSFLFPSKNNNAIKPVIPIPKEPSVDKSKEMIQVQKVKRTASLPTSDTTAKLTLRQSASTSSFRPKKKNEVLPPFDSQFILTEPSEIVPPTSNIITKAIDAINAILIQAPPDQPEDNSSWLAKKMRAKFSNFVDDMKSLDPKTIVDKRIVVVGVHGWFPMKLVRNMIGEPTGTSLKFCEQMASGVKLYFQSEHGVTLPANAITMVPLEGEGKVEDRVNQLYSRLIENSSWLEAVSSADVILWATHSQGTPVSIMLLQRLLERGHVHLIRQSVCLLAMAGISHGPFPSLKGSLIVKYFEADAARELFEFMDSNSHISLKFRQSLAYVLKCGIKVVLTGSMQDQVVPLYSAIMSSVTHSNILRSIYIDGHVYSKDDFLINLIVFALRLRNTGLPDYDLLMHLSEVLAGSLYALEGGHSTIYEELEVYMTAVRYTFETAPFGKYVRSFPSGKNNYPSEQHTTLSHIAARMEPFQAKQQQNPFYLPWVMHGICSDQHILADEVLKNDLSKLLILFDEWNPTSTRLKELKYRLDPIRTIRLP